MRFTDIFVRRPVLATVVSLLILVLGLRSLTTLPVLQYPRTQNAVVTVMTSYFGADPTTVAGFVTTPLENAIAQANGIDYLTSTSQIGVSTITANLRLNYDSGKALTEISTKVDSVLNQLPQAVQRPVITVKIGQTTDAMYIGFNSDMLTPSQVTDYLIRVVQPRLQSVPGVQTAELIGGKTFALRAWLDPVKLGGRIVKLCGAAFRERGIPFEERGPRTDDSLLVWFSGADRRTATGLLKGIIGPQRPDRPSP